MAIMTSSNNINANQTNKSSRDNRASHTRLLQDLAKNGVEPSDQGVRDKYDEFKMDVTKQALKILKERIPNKILYFNDQMNINASSGELLHTRDLVPFSMPVAPSPNPQPQKSNPNSSSPLLEDVVDGVEGRQSSTKRSRADMTPTAPFSPPPLSSSVPPLPSSSPSSFPASFSSPSVASHSQIIVMESRIRQEAMELIEMVGTVKLWIQLNVPRIEDGNNFGVAIQEEAIQELGRVEDAAFNLCDGIKYHTARAKLISKVLKYPAVEDYVTSVQEVDFKEWLHMKISLIDMRNSYSMLYDLLHKNWEKVVKPRAVDGSFMVM